MICPCHVESKTGTIRSMRTFLVLVCSFALVCAARGEKEHKKATTNAQTSRHVPRKTSQHVATHSEHPAGGNSAPVQHSQAHQHVGSPAVHPAQVPGVH